jgi:hypothetical protein
MMMMPAERFRQILNVRKLAGLRRIGKVRCKLRQLASGGRITGVLRGLGRVGQIRRDLLCDLLILRRVRLLNLLKLAQQLGER